MQIEVPNADIVDKTSILMIKLERVRDAQKLENIKSEVCTEGYPKSIDKSLGLWHREDLRYFNS